MALNLGGVAFHALASRMLGVAHYGTLYTLVSLVTLMLLPAALLAPVVARFAAEFAVRHDARHLRGLTLDLGRFCAAAIAAYIATGLLLAMPAAAYLGRPGVGSSGGGSDRCMQPRQRDLSLGMPGSAGFPQLCPVNDCGRRSRLWRTRPWRSLWLGLFGGILGFFAGTLCGLAVIAWKLMRRFDGVLRTTRTLRLAPRCVVKCRRRSDNPCDDVSGIGRRYLRKTLLQLGRCRALCRGSTRRQGRALPRRVRPSGHATARDGALRARRAHPRLTFGKSGRPVGFRGLRPHCGAILWTSPAPCFGGPRLRRSLAAINAVR